MSDLIQLLPDHVANQIAAGEVVQRPASVVKELLENSIDAGATTITLLLKKAGKTLIQVIDDGKGMSPTDARLCFERHATSKIRDAKDLFDLHTKGFRGEALASISAVAHVELKTKQEGEELGVAIKNEGNTIVSQEMIQTAKGTSIAVKNLFFNIPVRRNFMGGDKEEQRHIVNEFKRVALVHPQISFILYHNDRELYNLKSSNLRQRIVGIFGAKTDTKLVPINEETDILTVKGFVMKPEFAKKRRGDQFLFVNDRFIKNDYLNHAIVTAFEGLIESKSYPGYFLYLTVPPNTIDINIHPTKTEVEFDNKKALYAMLRATIKHSLGQYSVAPVLDFNRDASLDTPYEFKDKTPQKPQITVDRNFNPFKDDDTEQMNISKPSHSNFKKTRDTGNWESLYADLESDIAKTDTEQNLFDTELNKTPKTYQIQNKYIVSSIKSGIVLIHQSAAHQRIIYEDFLSKLENENGNSQQLLFPTKINLPKEDIGNIYAIKSQLEAIGFVFDEFTMEYIMISGIPTLLSESELETIFEQLLTDMKEELPNATLDYKAKTAESLAKSVCIKTGKQLNPVEQEDLVNRLFSCTEPTVSPSGKLTFKTLTLEQIDKIFKN